MRNLTAILCLTLAILSGSVSVSADPTNVRPASQANSTKSGFIDRSKLRALVYTNEANERVEFMISKITPNLIQFNDDTSLFANFIHDGGRPYSPGQSNLDTSLQDKQKINKDFLNSPIGTRLSYKIMEDWNIRYEMLWKIDAEIIDRKIINFGGLSVDAVKVQIRGKSIESAGTTSSWAEEGIRFTEKLLIDSSSKIILTLDRVWESTTSKSPPKVQRLALKEYQLRNGSVAILSGSVSVSADPTNVSNAPPVSAQAVAKAKATGGKKRRALAAALAKAAAEKKRAALASALAKAAAEKKRRALAAVRAKAAAAEKKRRALAENKSLSYLFKGSDKDILFLSNETGNAEHSIRGLDGTLVFEDNLASFCGLFGYKVDRSIRDYVSLSLSKSGIPGKLLPNAPKKCSDLRKTTVDLIVFERGAFLAQPLGKIKGVLDLSLNKNLTKFSVFQFDEHQKMLVAQTKKSKNLIAKVEKGEASGFGLLFPRANGRKVCILKEDDQGTIKQVLSNLRDNDPIKLKGLSAKNIVASSLNASFIKLKKKKCRYFVANAKSLRKMIMGMNRDQIKFSMHHEWGSMNLAERKPTKVIAKTANLTKTVAKQKPKGKKRQKSATKYSVAVIIGNKNYSERTPEVEFAHNDADAMKKFVTKTLGYRKGNIIDLRDATQAQMVAVFGNKDTHKGKLFGWVRPGKSDVTVFYSGHGVPGLKDRRGYLLPVDADPNLVEINGYPVDVLYKNLAKIEAKSMTVFLDACFSGDSPKGMIVRATSGISVKPKLPKKRTGLTVITAAQGDQFASWDEDAKMGLFTKNLLSALEGAADGKEYGNGDGQVTVKEVQRFLDGEMTYQARRRYSREQKATVLGDMSTVLSLVN
jgi:hypothetical protein